MEMMIYKIKQFFSNDANVNLIRDCLFIGILFLAMIIGIHAAMPHALAAEVAAVPETEPAVEKIAIQLPKIPDLIFDEPYPKDYKNYKAVIKLDSDYYAMVWSQPKIYGITGLQLVSTSSGYFVENSSFCRYYDIYKLANNAWVLDSSADEPTASTSNSYFNIATNHTAYKYGYDYDELLVYSSSPMLIYMGSVSHAAKKTVDATQHYDVSFPGFAVGTEAVSFGSLMAGTATIASGLFNVAQDAIDFIIANPLILIATLLFIMVAGMGIVKSFVTGV